MKAKDIYYEKENTKEYLDSRKITFGENTMVYNLSKTIADLLICKYADELEYKDLEDYLDFTFRDEDYKKYLLEETKEILEKEYSVNLEKIKI